MDSNPGAATGITSAMEVTVSTTAGETPVQASDGPDPELIRRAQAGDTAAFDAVYAATAARVFAVLLRMCADRHDAERLTQDTFVRAWLRLDTFRFQSRFSSWLHRIAVNAMLQDGRARGRREARVINMADHVLHDAPAATASTDERIDLERAIAALPQRARMVLVLHDIEGYTHDEIADMTGVAQGTAKSQLHRARSLLKEALNR